MPNGQPHIIFIMADQLGAAALGCYGSGVASTPTLDALAQSGLRFDRCYATSPVCAPNRACFLTGRSPAVHGLVSNNFVLHTDMPVYTQALQANGYRTGGFGKFHLTPMHCPLPADMGYLGFDESVNTDDTKWTWYDWVAREYPAYADTALAMCWNFWPSHPPHPLAAQCREAKERLLQPRYNESGWSMMYVSPLPAELHDTTYITNLGLDFMDRHLDGHAEQPFFCHISYVDPHDPYDPPEPYAHMFDPAAMPAPAPAEWNDANPIPELVRDRRWFDVDQHIYPGSPATSRLRALYHGSLKFLDDQIARVVEFVRRRGIADDTCIIFTTDHGEMLGDHDLITKGIKHYDLGVRCPLIVAGGPVAPGVTDRLTCTLDFFPTFCDLAGIPPQDRPPLEGRSFAPVCAGQPDPAPWPAVSVAFGGAETVITADRWRLTHFQESGRQQMFDLAADPREQRNLADLPAYAERNTRLLSALVDVMMRPRQVMQYRNLPYLDGKKISVANDIFQQPLRYYPAKDTPL